MTNSCQVVICFLAVQLLQLNWNRALRYNFEGLEPKSANLHVEVKSCMAALEEDFVALSLHHLATLAQQKFDPVVVKK